jgi:hypothetical protein
MAGSVAGTTSAWVHPAASLPDAARAELARRRDQLLVRATGRTLDLDDPGVAARFAAAGATTVVRSGAPRSTLGEGDDRLLDPDERYDTVIATGVLAGFADLGRVTTALARLVADDGALLFVEPVGRPGWLHVVAGWVDPRGRGEAWRSLHLDRDVPATVRAAGLVVCDLDRGELAHQPAPLRHWVSGRAVRIPGAAPAPR